MLIGSTETVGAGASSPLTPGYTLVSNVGGERTYMKENPLLKIRTYLIFKNDGTITVRKTQRIDATIDANVQDQNSFYSFGNQPMVRVANVPLIVDRQFKEKAGLNHRTGEFDRKKYNSLLDDRDNYKLKTVPKKIGYRKAEV